eukprot:TRINITY_DN5914_c0_g1_i1.p1 TRINITY_DN5914_c0_g1~~TRINITY_DN5914_c0_g1_i1.p1  ORF type:complete len:407 (+),score=103.06 TRINITY_DN5914_c0_g1_i1:1-1221(+)
MKFFSIEISSRVTCNERKKNYSVQSNYPGQELLKRVNKIHKRHKDKEDNMSEASVNIPRYIDDIFYRYKMPVIQTQVTGKHQGRETVIVNLHKIAKALEREPAYIMKFFSIEMSSRVTCNDRKQNYSVHGNYSGEELAQVLDRFIDKFVLCGSEACRLPETNLEMISNNLRLSCRACPTIHMIEDDHRLCTFIVRNPRNIRIVSEEEENMVRQSQEVEHWSWSVDTSKEAVEKRRQEAFGSTEKEEPTPEDMKQELESLQEFVNTQPDQAEFVQRALLLQQQFGWNDATLIQNIFRILFNGDILYQLIPNAKYLAPFIVNEKDEKLVLTLIEKLCHIEKSLIRESHHILSGFYEAKILEEDTIMEWFKIINKKLNPKICKTIRVTAKPFFQWLKTAESIEDELYEL